MEPDTPPSRLQQQQQQASEELQTAEQAEGRQTALEFATAEELLRHDRANTPVPETIESRLKSSIAAEPSPSRPWWKRWLGR